jgi:salicylate hydroxylase
MRIIIAGAGIGGLATALAAAHFGHEVIVLERATALAPVGAGIQLPPNAMRVFAALGLSSALEARSFRPTAIETRMGQSGREVFRVPLAADQWGAPYLHIHRADYIAVLAEALSTRVPDALRLGQTVESYHQTDAGVTVHLSGGDTVSGDIFIGADGIRSTVREQMLGPDRPRFTGNVAWRAVVPKTRLSHLPDPTACAWFGDGRHAVTYYLGEDRVNFVGVVEREDWQVESWTERGDLSELRADFAGWHPVIADILDAVDPEALYRWALFDRAPLARWTDGRVALLGDAAHPMLPFLAQGAAMAVEDAWVLASQLSDTESIGSALQAYQAERLPRTTQAQAASRANMKTFHKRGQLAKIAGYGPMWLGGRLAPAVVRGRFDWLYGTDVTQTGRPSV